MLAFKFVFKISLGATGGTCFQFRLPFLMPALQPLAHSALAVLSQ
jgi:hypothetical protein